MTRARFNVTYDIVTPESAEHGDTADNGFLDSREFRESVAGICGKPAGEMKTRCAMPLRHALQLCAPQEDSGRWFSEVDGRCGNRSGANETRSLHPPDNITAASYRRLSRLLGFAPC